MEKKSVRYKLERHRWPDEIRAERRKKRIYIIVVFAILLSFGLGMFGGQMLVQSPVYANSELNQLEKIYNIMKNDWYYGRDIENIGSKLISDAINGMMQEETDAHTYYMTMDQAAQFTGSMSGSLSGIGASFYEINGDIIIEKTFPGSPARKAGILPGDMFYEVDGTRTKGLLSTQLQALVLGEQGTKVNITVDRQGKLVSFEITRAIIMTSIFGEVSPDNIGILEITSVAETTATELKNYLTEFKEKNVKRLVIDLRNNSGGYLSTLEQMGSLLFPAGTVIIQQEYRNKSISQSKSKAPGEPFSFDKIVVLTNENTASAGEAFAAALRDNLGATIVGTTTYGKGSVQIPQAFNDGSVLKYTIAQWLTPNGDKINGVGVTPDIEVRLDNAYLYRNITLSQDYGFDSVSTEIVPAQLILEFMGYAIDRVDGYFSKATQSAITKFQQNQNMDATGILNQETMNRLIAANLKYWYDHRYDLDLQKIKAMELIRGE